MVWAPETVHCIIHFGTRFGGGGGGGGMETNVGEGGAWINSVGLWFTFWCMNL